MAGNSAYIIGTLAECDLGHCRIIKFANEPTSKNEQILTDLINMLTFDDPESVMNAAGTIATLVFILIMMLSAFMLWHNIGLFIYCYSKKKI